jgi:hypothetical protein
MQIDAAPPTSKSVAARLRRPPDLGQTERAAAAHFAQMLRQEMAGLARTDRPVLLVVRMSADLAQASARLIPVGDAAGSMEAGETAIAWALLGVPEHPARRRSLALRLASVAASTWRHRRQIERLGLVAV